MAAPLIEVFASIQGEGRFVGEPMAFLRVATCPIRCVYCDTPHSYSAGKHLDVGGRAEPNPVTPERACELVVEVVAASPYGSAALPVSITGGEPLVVWEFVAATAQELQERGHRTHLETAATDPDAMAAVAPHIDHVSADWKLPGTIQRGDTRDAHRGCIESALATATVRSLDAKVVVLPGVDVDAVAEVASFLAELNDPRVLAIVQPVTPHGSVGSGPEPDELAYTAAVFAERSVPFRVVPQVHKALRLP